MNATKVVRVLPPDVYDTLELSAYVYGGIGKGRAFASNVVTDDGSPPVCAIGHLRAAEPERHAQIDLECSLFGSGINAHDNDDAVEEINRRKGSKVYARVSFQEWCEELGVVRGES